MSPVADTRLWNKPDTNTDSNVYYRVPDDQPIYEGGYLKYQGGTLVPEHMAQRLDVYYGTSIMDTQPLDRNGEVLQFEG
jgi:hypothetical protein